jgi:hypothetical protein
MQSRAYSDEVSLAQLPGARIDSKWFRYLNSRFGVAIDIPTIGYRYEVPVNGCGVTLTSKNGSITITVYAHWVVNIVDDANNDVHQTISKMFDNAVAETSQKNGTVSYSVKKDDFYVISGKFGNDTYYERVNISPNCPAIFNSVRIFHPSSLERTLDGLVTRMSKSLRATCRGEEGAARISSASAQNELFRPRECVGQLIGPNGSVGNYGLTLGADWGVISPDNDRSGLEGCFFRVNTTVGKKILGNCTVGQRCVVAGDVQSVRDLIGNSPGNPPVDLLIQVRSVAK